MSHDFLKNPERRNYQRIDADLPVNLMVNGQPVTGTTSNVSCGGIFLPMKKNNLSEKGEVEVILHLPDSEKPVKVIGEITRVQSEKLDQEQGAGVAVRFKGLFDDNILAIDRFIKNRLH